MISSANKWRIAFLATFAASLPVIVFLGYLTIDQGVTVTYMSQGYAETKDDLSRLAKIFPKSTYSKNDILFLLRKNDPRAFIVETPCTIQLQGLRFEFNEQDKLMNITTQAQSAPEYACGGRT